MLTRAVIGVHAGSGSLDENSLSVEAPLTLLQWCLMLGRDPSRGELREEDVAVLEENAEARDEAVVLSGVSSSG